MQDCVETGSRAQSQPMNTANEQTADEGHDGTADRRQGDPTNPFTLGDAALGDVEDLYVDPHGGAAPGASTWPAIPETPGELRAWLREQDEFRLVKLSEACYEVITEKARERGDVEQLIEDSWSTAFNERDRLGIMPWLDGMVLWAPGSRQDRSARRHRCRFVRVNTDWVWEHPAMIRDEVRRSENGSKLSQQSLTLVAVEEGATVDVLTSDSVDGKHTLRHIDSFKVHRGTLERVSERTVSTLEHR